MAIAPSLPQQQGNFLLLHPRQQLGLIDCGQVKHITLDQRCVRESGWSMWWLPTHACACHVYRLIGQSPPDTSDCPSAFPLTARHAVPSPFPPLLQPNSNQSNPQTQTHRLALARLLLAVADKDRARIVKCYTDMGGWVGWHTALLGVYVHAYSSLGLCSSPSPSSFSLVPLTKQNTGFRTRDMNEEVIYKHAMVIWDRDDKESLGGKNIQVSLAPTCDKLMLRLSV